jgi:spermidine/putrescine transport system permease protein
VLLAYPFAWILAFMVPERWQRLALMLAVLPFWTSYVVRSYSWLLVLAEKGVVNSTLVNLGLLAEPLQIANTRAATVIGFVHFFVMLLTLTIFANLKQLSPNYSKAAADLGASGIQTFIHVILPADAAGHHGGRLPHLRAGHRRLHHAADPRGQQRAPHAAAHHDADRKARRLRSASALSLILMAVVTLAYLACARWLKIERA